MKTFFFKELKLRVFDSVYEPQEDSLLLANSIRIPAHATVLDLGCGCGIQGLNAALQGARKIVFSDINSAAAENAQKNAELNSAKINSNAVFRFFHSDLFATFSKKEKFDCIIFNPPYVPSEANKKWVQTDGGKKGREVLCLFLEQFPAFLKPTGTVFFLQSTLNGISKTKSELKKRNFQFEIVGMEKLFFEELVVFKAWKK